MRSMLKALAVWICLCASVACAAPFRPSEPIIPLSQIRPGMKGYGKTVFHGREIKTFPVEVLGIVKKKERPSSLILIRSWGPDVKAAGGLASGMSGSPIYFDGKLAGAFSFGWDFGDPFMGLVTPIEQMARLFEYRDEIPPFPAPAQIAAPKVRTELDSKFDELYTRYVGASSERKNVIIADGVSRRAMKKLESRLGGRVLTGGSDDNHVLPGPRQRPAPGASVSALLAWGDVALNVCGTLTAVDSSGRFLAFGHSFKNWGAVAYPIAYNTIHGIVGSLESPFKLSSAANIIGTVTQDRPEGIAGYLGRYAPAVSVSVGVEDLDSGKKTLKRFQMLSDQYAVLLLLPELVSGLADTVMGRVSGGTVRYTVSVDGRGVPRNWAVGDVVTAKEDALGEAMLAISPLLEKVIGNSYQDLGAVGIDFHFAVSAKHKKLLIEGLKLDSQYAASGGEITAEVTLRPWRQKPETRRFKLKVPPSLSGACAVVVRAGSPSDQEDSPQQTRSRVSSLAQMLSELKSAERACEVVIELVPQTPDESAASAPEPGADARRRKLKEGSMRVFRSEYVVDGSIQAPVLVVSQEPAL